MIKTISVRTLIPLIWCAAALGFAACSQQDKPSGKDDAAAKVPITTTSDEAREHYIQGRALLDDLHAVDANEAFAQAVAADDGFAMGYYMLAQTAQSTADYFDAASKANERAGSASEGEQLYIAALYAASQNDQEAQLDALTKLVAMYPQDERVHMQLGYYMNGQQDFAGAVEHYRHATAINPDFASAYNALGYAYRSLGDLDSARDSFARYIELIPDEANPYDSYAELLMEMGEYDESIANYRKALAIEPGFAASYAGISINESLKGEAELAQEAADQMLARARNFAERQGAMFSSVTSHLFAGNYDAATEVCETMLAEAEVKGDRAAMAFISDYMGDMMLVSGEPARAEEYYDAALDYRLQAGFNEANRAQAARTHLFKTAIAAMNMDDAEAAATRVAEYNAAAQMNGTAFEKRRINELSAFLAMYNEEYESAAVFFGEANQLDPIVLYWAAVIHADLGHTDQAIDLATRAANRNTLSPNLPFFRGAAQALLEELNAG
ncbi:MAG: tetratricopeptide repeat protein [Gammaproteobacteria bacterium]|nr:tetratricopeptide repeat protein [Gammaproteobacteria bacterium]